VHLYNKNIKKSNNINEISFHKNVEHMEYVLCTLINNINNKNNGNNHHCNGTHAKNELMKKLH